MIDVSTLSITVKSDGIKEATKGLEALALAASKVDKSILPLLPAMQKQQSEQDKVTKTTQKATEAADKYISRLQLKANVMGKNAAQTAALTAAQRGFSAGAVKQAQELGASIDAQAAAMAKASTKGTIFNNTVKSMISAFLLYKSVGFAKSIIEAGDSWAMMASRLKVATGSMQEANKVQGELYAMAQSLRIPLEDSTRLYTRMLVPMKALGKTSEDVMKVTEGVGLALQLNGSTGAEASSVMLQFSQSMAAGRLNGAELNAVLEGAPPIIRAIEAELVRTGKGFSQTGKTIKQMGADGQLGIDLITNAIKNALPGWKKDFSELPITVDSALTVIKNAWTKAMGEMSQDTELNKNLSKALMSVVEIMPIVRDTMISVVTFITDNIKALTYAISSLLALKFLSWVTSVATALSVGATAAGAFGPAMAAVATAISAVLGPVGLLIAALGVLYAAYKLWADDTPKQSAATTSKLVADTDTRIAVIRKEIDAINEKYAAENKKAPATEAVKEDSTLARNKETILRLTDAQVRTDNAAIKAGLQISIDRAKADNDRLEGIIAVSSAVKAADEMQKKTASQAKLYNEERKKWDKDYADQQKIDAIKAMDINDEQKKSLIALAIAKQTKGSTAKAVSEANKQEQAMAALNAKYQDQLDIKSRLEDPTNKNKSNTANEKALNLLIQQEEKAKGIEIIGIRAQINKAQQIVDQEKLNSLEKDRLDTLQYIATLEAGSALRSQEYAQELAGAGMGSRAKAEQEKVNAINKEYQAKKVELENLKQSGGGMDNDVYAARLAGIEKFNAEDLKKHAEHLQKKLEQEQNWALGASAAMANYADNANNLNKQTEDLFTNAFKGMEDALVEFTMTGKLSFSDLAKSIIADIVRIQAKQTIAGLMGGASSSGGGSGILGGLLSLGMSLIGASGGAPTAVDPVISGGTSWLNASPSFSVNAKGNAFSGGAMTTKFADGGAFTNGVVNKPTGFDMGLMGEAGPEAIMPLQRTSDGSLGVVASGGSSSGETKVTYAPTINIDARADKAEVEKIVNNAVKSGNAKLVDDLTRARRL
jgi:lambda family phage tail tape measure protein